VTRTARTAAALLLALMIYLVGAPAPAPAQEAAAEGDPGKAEALADRVMEALGGDEAWGATRYIEFRFAGARTHWWDRYTGRHRLEGTNREGESYLVLHDIDDRGETGRAWIGGEPAEGEAAAELVKNAYAAWINDTYWLLAPYKLRDPGVSLAYDGQETVGGVTYDKLLLTFEGVGLTPGDRYWMYVHPETGLVDRWAYVLESQEPPPTAWEWKGWKSYGPGIMLADQRVQPEDGRELPLAPISVPDELPDSVFESPEPVE
jgi:hypothetical protein